MVDWSSSLQLVNAALDVSDHAIGFKLFRLLYGALLSLVMLGYVGIASAVWGEQSIWKREGFATHRLRPFGLFDLLPEPVAGLGAILLGVASALFLIFTRLPAGYVFPLIWVSLCTLQGRNAFMCYGGDDVFRLLALAFLYDFAAPTPPTSLVLAQVLMLSIYWNTAIYKLREPLWQRGEALYGFAKLSMFTRWTSVPIWDRRVVYRTLTYATLAVELAIAPLLLFQQTAVLGCILAIAMHVALHLLFRIHLFQPIMICGLCVFPTDSTYQQLGEWIGL